MKYIKKICVGLALLAILICSGSSFAAMQYKLLSPLPDENGSISANQQITIGGQDEDLAKYFKNLYRLGILIATGLAVLMVMWGGIEYMTTDAIGGKEGGKEKIQNAVLGLMLALGSFLILRTIDPDLVDVGFNIDEIDQEKIKNLSGQAGSLEFLDISRVEPGTVQARGNGYDSSYTGEFGGGSSDPNAPIGVKNRNFGNVKKPGSDTWEGTVGYDSHGHAIFDSEESGIRAFMLNLRHQYANNNLKTINQILGTYTSVAGDRAAYAAFIKRKTGFNPLQDLGLVKNGTVDRAVLYPLARAMFDFENGKKINVSDGQLDEAYRRAFGN